MNRVYILFKSKNGMNILGIESSCDETAGALLKVERGAWSLLSNTDASQIDIHKKYGGVVPEVAARSHITALIPVIEETVGNNKPDVIAVTAGPGLVTSLGVGVMAARSLSYLWNIPLIPINHIEGHLYANWLSNKNDRRNVHAAIRFPALVLIVSGGHTELILMRDHGKYKKIGQTLDDAAGEAFDKVAKMLALGYPGGPVISRLAQSGDPARFNFPRALIHSSEHPHDFSFSGVKTSVLYCIRDLREKKKYSKRFVPHLCASFQKAVVDVLVEKTIYAAGTYNVNSVLLGGGVVANALLRATMTDALSKQLPKVALHIPSLAYCTDNAAMIAMAGYFHARKGDCTPWQRVDVRGGWGL